MENIKRGTDHDVEGIHKKRSQQLSSRLCKHNTKVTDRFCISHNQTLCADCIEKHTNCTVGKLDIVPKDIILTTQFMNVEKRISNLYKYMNNNLPKLITERILILNKKEDFQKSIKDSKKELTSMLDKVETEGLRDIENYLSKLQSFHDEMSKLNISVKNKEQEIAMCQQRASDSEIKLSLTRIENDLQKYENWLLINLKDSDMKVIEPISKLKNIGQLSIKICYDPIKRVGQAISSILEPFSVTKIQPVKDMQLDEIFVFDIPGKTKENNITGCTILEDSVMCFVDSKCSRLTLKTADGIYKKFHFPSMPLDITAISNSTVAILHRTSVAILNVNNMQIDDFQFEPAGKFRFITFHNGNLIVCVGMCSFSIINLLGQKIKEINIDETLISCITCWDNNIFYANRDKNTIYRVDLHTGESTLIISVSGIVNSPSCIAADKGGMLFVVGSASNNIVAISVYGEEYKELVRGLKNIQYPKAIAYNSTQRRLLICSPIGHSTVYSFVN
ncbi:Hypothetical predicted protein [Mytilus galloprovincialis]|uniref:B box-type domain-containing protein n=1 Tax=Mytilus galloprovincialis TaxID=29158 RepID=A0A8B6HLH8_MYTGA|nr:Hypothetical predicted protein [Mytilus galloprovincialis]